MPALLYRPDRIDAELEYVTRAARQLAVTGLEGARPGAVVAPPRLRHVGRHDARTSGRRSWPTSSGSKAIVTDAGLKTALHPHWGMAIETGTDIDRLLESSDGRVVPRHRPRLPGRRRPGRGRAGGARPRPPCPPQGRRPGQGRAGPERRGPVPRVGHRRAVRAARAGRRRHRRRDRRARGRRLPRLVCPRAGRVAQGASRPIGEGPKADAVDSVAYLRGLDGAPA